MDLSHLYWCSLLDCFFGVHNMPACSCRMDGVRLPCRHPPEYHDTQKVNERLCVKKNVCCALSIVTDFSLESSKKVVLIDTGDWS